MIVGSLEDLVVPTDRLHTLEGNPRRGDVDAVARSLARFGQVKPIVALLDGTVVAGNHTLAAARQLGWTSIAVNYVDMDMATAKAFALADNRTAELGGYDNAELVAMLAEVRDVDPAMFVDTGWTDQDLANLVAVVEQPPPVDLEAMPAWAPSIVADGDVWVLGRHRLICGDCRDPAVVDRLLEATTVQLACTSPPYAEQRAYDPESAFQPVPPDEYVGWFEAVAGNVAAHLARDGSWLVNIKPAADGLDTLLYVHDLVRAHTEWGWHFAHEFCWERHGVPKAPVLRLKNQFEPIYQFTRDRWKFRPDNVAVVSDSAIVPVGKGGGETNWRNRHGNTVTRVIRPEQVLKPNRAQRTKHDALGEHQGHGLDVGDYKGTGMAYPGNRLPTFSGSHEATGHSAAFPVGLPAFLTRLFTDPGDAIFDPFVGSGSSLLAAEAEGRVGFGVEISPAYCDIVCKRFEKATGIRPVVEATGEPVSFMEGDR